jgi:hypothetical protein
MGYADVVDTIEKSKYFVGDEKVTVMHAINEIRTSFAANDLMNKTDR